MKIAYVLNHNVLKNDGVTKKIKGQTGVWKSLGHEVEIFSIVPELGSSILEGKQYYSGGYLASRLLKKKDLLGDLEKFSPGCVYFRYDTWSVTLSKVLKNYKVIAELNTYDLGEYALLMKKEKTVKSVLRYYSYKFLRGLVFKNLSGIVGVTQEITEHETVDKFNKMSTFLPNAINLNDFITVKTVEKEPSRTSLFFIGTPNQPWHGVDIITNMATEMPEYDFHVVGIDGESTGNIYWHGYLQKNEYLEVLKKCHICIGSLALYRNEMEEACPLKVREYLAYGYPIIIGYKDTAFTDSDDAKNIFLKIDSQNVAYSEVRNFIESNKNKIVTKDDVYENISADVIEAKRIAFLESVVEV
jgi:hypothetical protein